MKFIAALVDEINIVRNATLDGCTRKMKHQLNDYHRDIPEADLIADLMRVSKQFDGSYISRPTYEKFGMYSVQPFLRTFGSWSNSLEAAGLRTSRTAKEFQKISDRNLIEDVQLLARQEGTSTVTSTRYSELGRYSI